MKESLENYLKENTQIREDILNQKLIFDLKEACAKNFGHLKIYKADVDINGFDLIFDDNEQMLIKCQIKSKFKSTTQQVDIHNSILRPDCHLIEDLGFEVSPCHNDRRGIILIAGDVKDDNITVEYSYLDCFLLRAMALGIFSLGKNSQKNAEKLINKINNHGLFAKSKNKKSLKAEKLQVKYSLFFPVKDVLGLIEFMDLGSISLTNKIREISKGKLLPQKQVDKNLMKLHWNELNEALFHIVSNKGNFVKNLFPDNF